MKTIKELTGTSTHGNCCSCGKCHNYHDDCNCEKIETLKEVLELIDKFPGEDYTDLEIWEDMKKELKQKIEGK